MRIARRMNEQTPKTMSLGIVGKIKIGEKVDMGGGKSRPASLDYFRPDAPEQYMDFFRKVYGERPTKITVVFLSNDINEAVRNFYELRDGEGKRLAYGDGNTFYVATKQADNAIKDVVMEPENPQQWMNEVEKKSGQKWRERLVLRFAIPAIPVLGFWEFSTHGSESTIPQILGAVDTMQQMAGRIAGIPFDLIVEKKRSDKSGSKSVYTTVKIVANISAESAEIVRNLPMQFGAILTEQKVLELSAASHRETEPTYTPQQEHDAVEVEYFEAGETAAETADREFKKLRLEKIEDFTQAARFILKMADKDVRQICAEKLGDLAQSRGYQYDKANGIYRMPK